MVYNFKEKGVGKSGGKEYGMYEVFLSGLREWYKKLTGEIDALTKERKKVKEGNSYHVSLTVRINLRCETRIKIEHQIELEEAKISRMIAESGGRKK